MHFRVYMQLEARPWQILGDVGGAGPVLGGESADSRRAQGGRGAQRAQRVPARHIQRRLETPRAPRASRLHCRQRTHLYRLTFTKINFF